MPHECCTPLHAPSHAHFRGTQVLAAKANPNPTPTQVLAAKVDLEHELKASTEVSC